MCCQKSLEFEYLATVSFSAHVTSFVHSSSMLPELPLKCSFKQTLLFRALEAHGLVPLQMSPQIVCQGTGDRAAVDGAPQNLPRMGQHMSAQVVLSLKAARAAFMCAGESPLRAKGCAEKVQFVRYPPRKHGLRQKESRT
jgi:hypothetical protein